VQGTCRECLWKNINGRCVNGTSEKHNRYVRPSSTCERYNRYWTAQERTEMKSERNGLVK